MIARIKRDPMKKREYMFRSAAIALTFGVSALSLSIPVQALLVTQAQAATVSQIDVRGNTRISDDAVKGYLGIVPGRSFNDADIDNAVKALFNSGLFGDVRITRSGSTLVVVVEEQAIVNQTIFQGNRKIKDRDLAGRVRLQSRGAFDEFTLQGDVQTIEDAYRNIGRNDVTVETQVVPLGDGRVNVVFKVNEGDRTKIGSVNFIGNDNIGDTRLRSVIATKRSNLLSAIFRDDIYSDDKLRSDEDRLARYYFNRGYADFRVLSSAGDFDVEQNAYNVTISVDEGARYKYGDVVIDSTIPGIDTSSLASLVETRTGKTYSAEDVEKTIIAITERLATSGYAFAEVTPRGDRDFASNTISITYAIDQGPRTYVERIEIRGNDRTRDYVIRREFDLSEGDAFNQVMIQKARGRLDALGFFESINISTIPGSEPDRVIIVVDLVEQSTGDLGVGAGYAVGDDAGVVLEGSISERNFLGRGQFVKFAVGGSADTRTYTLSFTEPYFMGSRVSAGFDIYRNTQEQDNYDSELTGATVRFGLPITDKLTAQVAYNYVEETYTCSTAACTAGALSTSLNNAIANSPWLKSSLSGSLTYSTLDNLKDPREGLFVNGTLEYAGIGGNANFLKATGKASFYQPIIEDADIIGLVSVGAGHIEAIDNGVRAFDLFKSSKSIIRGFDQNGIGPYDLATATHLGGQTYFKASAEVQFPLPLLPESLGLRGAFFADAASLHTNSLEAGAASLGSEWRASVGAGITWASPFGPLRVDYAIPVVKSPTDKVREFSFGVSTKF